MDGDLYSYLIGAAPTDPQKQATIAEQLRRRRSFGELGALTGDRVLQSFGGDLSKSADQYATQLQNTRQKDIDNAQTEKYQTGQLQHMHNLEDLERRGQTLNHIYQMLMAQAALEKADKTGVTKNPRLRQGDITDLQNMAQDIGEFSDLENYIKSGHGFGAKEIDGYPIPGLRSLTNTMARFGYGSDEDKAAFEAKQKFDRLYTLGARNRLFGATLTPNEMKAWEDANPQTRQSDAQILSALPILKKVFSRRLVNKVGGLTKENYDPDAISQYADLEHLGLENPALSGAGHGPMAPQKRVKVDQFGNEIGN